MTVPIGNLHEPRGDPGRGDLRPHGGHLPAVALVDRREREPDLVRPHQADADPDVGRDPRWVQRFTTEFIEAARPCRHAPSDRWFVDETYVKVADK
jgi:hypothetical protein